MAEGSGADDLGVAWTQRQRLWREEQRKADALKVYAERSLDLRANMSGKGASSSGSPLGSPPKAIAGHTARRLPRKDDGHVYFRVAGLGLVTFVRMLPSTTFSSLISQVLEERRLSHTDSQSLFFLQPKDLVLRRESELETADSTILNPSSTPLMQGMSFEDGEISLVLEPTLAVLEQQRREVVELAENKARFALQQGPYGCPRVLVAVTLWEGHSRSAKGDDNNDGGTAAGGACSTGTDITSSYQATTKAERFWRERFLDRADMPLPPQWRGFQLEGREVVLVDMPYFRSFESTLDEQLGTPSEDGVLCALTTSTSSRSSSNRNGGDTAEDFLLLLTGKVSPHSIGWAYKPLQSSLRHIQQSNEPTEGVVHHLFDAIVGTAILHVSFPPQQQEGEHVSALPKNMPIPQEVNDYFLSKWDGQGQQYWEELPSAFVDVQKDWAEPPALQRRESVRQANPSSPLMTGTGSTCSSVHSPEADVQRRERAHELEIDLSVLACFRAYKASQLTLWAFLYELACSSVPSVRESLLALLDWPETAGKTSETPSSLAVVGLSLKRLVAICTTGFPSNALEFVVACAVATGAWHLPPHHYDHHHHHHCIDQEDLWSHRRCVALAAFFSRLQRRLYLLD